MGANTATLIMANSTILHDGVAEQRAWPKKTDVMQPLDGRHAMSFPQLGSCPRRRGAFI
jgi:hypothetical protein